MIMVKSFKISMSKTTDHIIANGRLHSDKNGNYTFSSQRGLSVTDYLLLSKNDIISLHDFKILEWSHFSDHAAVYFTFYMQCINDENSSSNCLSDQRLTFNEEKVHEFKELLKNTIHSISNENISNTNAVLQVATLTNFLHEKANAILRKTFKINTNKSDKNSINQQSKNLKQQEIIFHIIKLMRIEFHLLELELNTQSTIQSEEGQRLENIAKKTSNSFGNLLKML